MIKNPPADAREVLLIPGWRRSPGEENGKPLQYLAWEIPWTDEDGTVVIISQNIQKSNQYVVI